MKYEAQKQLVEMLKNVNKGVEAVPDVAKTLIRQYQYQQIFLAVLGFLMVLLFSVTFVYWIKHKDGNKFNTYYGEEYSEISGLGYMWLITDATLLISGTLLFISGTSHAIAPGLSLIKQLLLS